MPKYQNWLLTEKDQIATLTINRPDKLNSLTPETLYELREITKTLKTQKNIRAVIVEGKGDHFSSGADLNLIKGLLEDSEVAHRQVLLDLQLCLDEFEALEKPTIAKLKGFCIGAGLVLALCCDFRIASQRTIFSLPEVKIGLPILMGTQRLTRVTGMGAAKEMILLGKRFSAKDALAYGLLHKVVLPDQLDNAVADLAEKFSHLPPITVGLAKRLINKGYDLTLRESQDLELDALDELLKNPELREAIESYRSDKMPKYSGE